MNGMFSAIDVPRPYWNDDITIKTNWTIKVEKRNKSIAKLLVFPRIVGKKHVPKVTASNRLINTAKITGITCPTPFWRELFEEYPLWLFWEKKDNEEDEENEKKEKKEVKNEVIDDCVWLSESETLSLVSDEKYEVDEVIEVFVRESMS
jgi:hypothetical protein